MQESGKKDSTIIAYVKSMNEIQDNLDSIKAAEKILSVNSMGGEHKHNAIVEEVSNRFRQPNYILRPIYQIPIPAPGLSPLILGILSNQEGVFYYKAKSRLVEIELSSLKCHKLSLLMHLNTIPALELE